MGINTVQELPKDETGICIVRSHGIEPDKINEMTQCGFEVVDLTCLDVKKVQKKAIELSKEDYLVLILGKREHPEVVAINANAKQHSDNVFVVANIDELKQLTDLIKQNKKVGVVIQTTQKIDFLNEVVSYLLPITSELKVFNTICNSTIKRQQEAQELAKSSDLMVVVGSKKSANTTHLAEIVSEITKTIHIENKEELNQYKELVQKAINIGITAGASTPDNVINDVINQIEKI